MESGTSQGVDDVDSTVLMDALGPSVCFGLLGFVKAVAIFGSALQHCCALPCFPRSLPGCTWHAELEASELYKTGWAVTGAPHQTSISNMVSLVSKV